LEIIASLQSTLGITELRKQTLETWRIFMVTLRFADIGPYIGRTTAALAAQWSSFDDDQKAIALDMVQFLADNAQNLTSYLDEVVGVSNVPEMKRVAAKLTEYRRSWSFQKQVETLLDRTRSKNTAVSTVSLIELRAALLSYQNDFHRLSQGDTFDPLISRLVSCLMSSATRDGDCPKLRDLSYECLGLLGAVDPDRLSATVSPSSMTIMSNFTDPDESVDFALHLIRDLLVDAFRATNDTKHQNHLAFAIQELLRFCGFTPKILQGSSVPLKLRSKWHQLPKDQHETLTPLLESRFSLSDAPPRTFAHPIYSHAASYREWVQMWTTDLVAKVMSVPGEERAVRDSKAIFGVIRGVLRNQDVTVAHHILPHLVLNVLLSGVPTSRDEIWLEINTVLQDQVNPAGPTDKRSLSSQVIFDLLDHLSKWLRLQRVGRTDRSNQTKIVDGVLSSIETELLANAALQSKAFARSLRSFERRIVQLRQEKRDNSELQTYFERLHQIYAELDEPDGMEGISTFVISPSLEHQIREHEETGRWTSAQSCWEVRLQQSPEDVTLHVGLLKCLRNLGHYGTPMVVYSS
jgi:serine/threonine-protein kinase ATR